MILRTDPKIRYRLVVNDSDTAKATVVKERLHRKVCKYHIEWQSEVFGFQNALVVLRQCIARNLIPKWFLQQFLLRELFEWSAVHCATGLMGEMYAGSRESESFTILPIGRLFCGMPAAVAFSCPTIRYCGKNKVTNPPFLFQQSVFPSA